MPRTARVEYAGAHYHVMCRGNNGADIFFDEDGYRLFLSTLTEACEQTGWFVHAYCLMSNHYHLLIETPEPNLVAGMKWFQGTYTQRINAMFRRRGHLFQGRYKALPVQTGSMNGGLEYFRQISTYIHLNPFRAGFAGVNCDRDLHDYPWSSYPAYCGRQRKRPIWLERKKVLKTWDLEEGNSGTLRAYREKLEGFMRGELERKGEHVERFDRQINWGWFLGSEEFRESLKKYLEAGGGELRNDQRLAHGEAEAERLYKRALAKLELKEKEWLGLRKNDIRRQVVVWFLNDHTTVTGEWIRKRLGMGAISNVSRALRRFREAEDRETKRMKKRIAGLRAEDSE